MPGQQQAVNRGFSDSCQALQISPLKPLPAAAESAAAEQSRAGRQGRQAAGDMRQADSWAAVAATARRTG